jgi:hypothetical protein
VSTSTRSASRSAWWPASRRSTSRRWCRCGCSPTRSRAATRSCSSRRRRTRRCRSSSPSCSPRPGCRTGVFNVVQGDKVAVDRLLEHPDIAAVSFVGSTPIAKYIYETGTSNGKRVQALGGAKNHMLVLPDADIDMAADARSSAAYGSAGERCMAISVVLVGEASPTSSSTPRSRSASRRSRSVPGTDPDARWARSSPREHRDKVASYLDQRPGRGRHGRGRRARAPALRSRRLLPRRPSLIDHVSPAWSATDNEIFGPVLSVVRVHDTTRTACADQRQPVRQRHGDLHPRRRRRPPVPVRHRGRDGRHQRADPGAGRYYSFGGWKASLFGDTHMYGPEGISSTPAARWSRPLARPGDLDRSTSASRRPGDARAGGAWTSASSCRPPAAGAAWSSSPSGPRRSGSPTCGRSTPTSCGRSRTSSTARSWPRPAT